MSKKWLLRFGTSILALTIMTGCANTNNDDVDPIEDEPMNQQDDNNRMNEDNVNP